MVHLDKYDKFRDLGKEAPAPAGHEKIRVHWVYNVKHDRRNEAKLVADGNLTYIPIKSFYSGVVYIYGI